MCAPAKNLIAARQSPRLDRTLRVDASRASSPLERHQSDDVGDVLLSVIVPVYNEQATIDRLIAAVFDAPYRKQIIVVDDASTDGSARLLRKWRETGQIELLSHPCNQGKGAAIRTGLARARGQFTVIQDADLEYDPQDYQHVIQPLLEGRAEVVYGSRRLGCKRSWRQLFNPFYHGVTVLNLCVRVLYGVRVTDEATCYKAFPTAVLRAMELACQRFEFCPEVTAKACRMGWQIVEVPIHYASRTARDGKKIGLRDAFEAAWTLWRWRKWLPAPEQHQPKGSVSMDPRQQVACLGSVAAHVAIVDKKNDRVAAKR